MWALPTGWRPPWVLPSMSDSWLDGEGAACREAGFPHPARRMVRARMGRRRVKCMLLNELLDNIRNFEIRIADVWLRVCPTMW